MPNNAEQSALLSIILPDNSEQSMIIMRNDKKDKRKVQEVPQSQAAALPRHQEEEETDKHTRANRTNIRNALRLALFPKRGNRNAKRTEKHKNKITQGKS